MRSRLLAAVAGIGLCLLPAFAQTDPHSNVFLGGDKPKKEKAPTSRAVKGMVTDGSGKPLENAVVTLTNEDTHVKLSFFTKKDGRYNFDGLSFTTDYKLAAQFKNDRSEVRTLSQYDHQANVVRILQVGEPSDTKPPSQTAQKQN